MDAAPNERSCLELNDHFSFFLSRVFFFVAENNRWDEEDYAESSSSLSTASAEPYTTIKHQWLNSALDRLLSQLSEREQVVIRLRFGFDGSSRCWPTNEKMSLAEVGHLLGLSSGRARQIEARAISKLCSSRSRNSLQVFPQRGLLFGSAWERRPRESDLPHAAPVSAISMQGFVSCLREVDMLPPSPGAGMLPSREGWSRGSTLGFVGLFEGPDDGIFEFEWSDEGELS